MPNVTEPSHRRTKLVTQIEEATEAQMGRAIHSSTPH